MNYFNVSRTTQMLLVKLCALWVYNQKVICFIYLIFSWTLYLKTESSNKSEHGVCMYEYAYVFFCKAWLDEAWVKSMIKNNVIFCLHNNLEDWNCLVHAVLKMDLPLKLICLHLGMCRVKDNDIFLMFCVTPDRSLLKSQIRHMHRLTADFSN